MNMAKVEENLGDIAFREASINVLSEEEFVDRWRDLVGEPPAAMLESRHQMLALLVESVPVESLEFQASLLNKATGPSGKCLPVAERANPSSVEYAASQRAKP